ncbi:MAG: cytochrome c [Bdellovibrionota bacterium]
MRQPVEGTIARGDLITDVVFETGKTSNGQLVGKNPVRVTSEIMARGQERYNIYCRPCHGAVGDGQGIVYQRGKTQGFVQPTSFHS